METPKTTIKLLAVQTAALAVDNSGADDRAMDISAVAHTRGGQFASMTSGVVKAAGDGAHLGTFDLYEGGNLTTSYDDLPEGMSRSQVLEAIEDFIAKTKDYLSGGITATVNLSSNN